MNDPRFEVFPEQQRYEGGKVNHPRYGLLDALDRNEPTGEYGWRFRAANGQITATGNEGFTRRENAHRAIRQFLAALADTGVDLHDKPVPEPPILDVAE